MIGFFSRDVGQYSSPAMDS